MTPKVRFISAGAGSGKTYRLTELLRERLASGQARPEGVLATTFTRKAAAELVERVRQRLVTDGLHAQAVAMDQALIGTVHGVCGQLLGRYAFEAGLSPRLDVVAEDAQAVLFNEAMESATGAEDARELARLARSLGIEDWRRDARGIVDQARSNNLQAADLAAHAKRSTRSLLALLPRPRRVDLDAALTAALDTALASLPAEGDETKGTARYVDLVTGVRDAHRQGVLAWSDWAKLAKQTPTKKSLAAAAPLAEAAADYERHPRLRKEITAFVERLFEVAARSLGAYQALKRERGLVDFVDQEHLALRLVRQPDVAARLGDELDLLLVDEFQDTSPIQLALFLELARLAGESVWVGDVKQAIYGFRGTDPELMHAVIRALTAAGSEVEVLGNSWRSRPPLVRFANALFVPAFEAHLGEARVALQPRRDEVLRHPPLRLWHIEGRNKCVRATAFADALARLLEEGIEVVDRDTKEVRPVRADDVAVLCRSNDNVAAIAAALRARGVAAAFREPGLLATPEGCLVLACLRRLVDPGDTLASAEIISMTSGEPPETWLQDRLRHLDEGGHSWRWGIDGALHSPVLAALDALRDTAVLLSPGEALDAVLERTEVRRAVLAWGPTAPRGDARLANIESLRLLAQAYEDACASTRTAATVAGLVLHLGELAQDGTDQKGIDGVTGAVQVLTHHRAKGLEWPVVVATDMDHKPRGRLWGLKAVAETDTIDLADPLAGRWLRYWPWPFGRQSAGIALADAAAATEAGRLDAAESLREELRLLYVSLTRARDLLILAWPHGKPATWLDGAGADWLAPNDWVLKLPGGRTLECIDEDVDAMGEPPGCESGAAPVWFAPRVEGTVKLPARFSASAAAPEDGARVGRVVRLGPRIDIAGKPDSEQVGNAVHAFLAADVAGPREGRAELAGSILERHGLDGSIGTDALLGASDRLQAHLDERFPGRAIDTECPVDVTLDTGQRMHGWIDLLVDAPDGWVIIDHKTFPGGADQATAKALCYSGQLAAYADALCRATSTGVHERWVHFPMVGLMVEILPLSGVATRL